MSDSVVILSAVRTPIGSFLGQLSTVPASKLGSAAIKEAVARAGLKPEQIDEVYMGHVLTAAAGQAPARQAALFSGIPNTVPCTTINKVCGSGLKAAVLAAQSILVGDSNVAIGGGQENMSLTPHMLEKSRSGFKMGNVTMTDHMVKDGLWDVYKDFHMGNAAEICAREKNFSREEQDAFAVESYKRAQTSIKENLFKNEIAEIQVTSGKDTVICKEDEEPFKVKFDKIPTLKPAFEKTGTITAANASSINDGAAALVLASEKWAVKSGLKPLAKITGWAQAAQAPEWFTTAPAKAMNSLVGKLGLKMSDVDLFEINEAFSVVALATIKELGLDLKCVNPFGGAVALGHPIGASGARILTTLVHGLHTRNLKRGMASICIGGGEALAVMIERV